MDNLDFSQRWDFIWIASIVIDLLDWVVHFGQKGQVGSMIYDVFIDPLGYFGGCDIWQMTHHMDDMYVIDYWENYTILSNL